MEAMTNLIHIQPMYSYSPQELRKNDYFYHFVIAVTFFQAMKDNKEWQRIILYCIVSVSWHKSPNFNLVKIFKSERMGSEEARSPKCFVIISVLL